MSARSELDKWLEEFVRQAVELSLSHVDEGGIPFTALVVHPRDATIGSGVNRVGVDHDPTAHAEVVAMRDACANRAERSLAGCTLVASGEPCALCYAVALWCDIERIVFAVDRHAAAAAGFDYVRSYEIFAVQPTEWPIEITHLPVDGGDAPFNRWRARQDL